MVAIAQRSDVAAFAVAGEVFEGSQRDQGRAMHAGEAGRVEPRLQRADAQVAQIALRLGIEFRVVAGGFDPENIVGPDGHDLLADANEEAVEVVGAGGLFERDEMLRGPLPKPVLLNHAFDGLSESSSAVGFEQLINDACLESLDGEVVMCRGKDDVGQIVEGFEHVEEDQVGRARVDFGDSLPAIAALRDDLDLGILAQILP